MTLTDERLAELARYAKSAPPGPWAADRVAGGWNVFDKDDNYIASTADDIVEGKDRALTCLMAAAPELLAEVVRLREENAALRVESAALRERVSDLEDSLMAAQLGDDE